LPSITFWGHTSFMLSEKEKEVLLFDPFISENPLSPVAVDEITADYILISHAHWDHFGDAYAIAEQSGAKIISTSEIAKRAAADGYNAHAQHIGGRSYQSFGSVKLTLAFHGSGIEGGHACGFVVDYYGKRIYFAGDTGLFYDMKLIGELDPLDLALLPIGDNFTMGIDDAVVAASFLQAKVVIPYHYNTWPLIELDPEIFKKKVEENTNSKCVILSPGERYAI